MQPDGHHLARALFGLLVSVARIVLDGRSRRSGRSSSQQVLPSRQRHRSARCTPSLANARHRTVGRPDGPDGHRRRRPRPHADRCSAHPSVKIGSDDDGGKQSVQLEPGQKSWFTCAAQSRQINALLPTTSCPASPSFRPQKGAGIDDPSPSDIARNPKGHHEPKASHRCGDCRGSRGGERRGRALPIDGSLKGRLPKRPQLVAYAGSPCVRRQIGERAPVLSCRRDHWINGPLGVGQTAVNRPPGHCVSLMAEHYDGYALSRPTTTRASPRLSVASRLAARLWLGATNLQARNTRSLP
jgi:hypothetical protein